MHSKSKPKPNSKQSQLNSQPKLQTVSQLMDKAKAAQLQRQQLLKAKFHLASSHPQSSTIDAQNSDHRIQQLLTLNNPDKSSAQTLLMNSKAFNQNIPFPQTNSIQSSFRPFESNRTLEPYLINIKEEYICGISKHQSGQKHVPLQYNHFQQIQKQPKKGLKEQVLQPVSNSESIQLSESRQVSEEMLLHNSVTSKFLESPSLSLGLVESNITKKQANSQNNSKILKKKPLRPNDFDSGQILFVTNTIDPKEHKQSIEFYQQFMKNYHHQQQQAMKKSLLKDASHQFPEDAKMQDSKDNIVAQSVQTKGHLPIDIQFNNSIMASYQMEVEYLRKVNLYQSFEIQKLRKLIRTNESNHLCSVPSNHQGHQHTAQTNSDKTTAKSHFKKAIDIIKARETLKPHKRTTFPFKQIDSNAKNTSTENTCLQFSCGDYSSEFNNKPSVSFVTNNLTTSESFHLNKKSSFINKTIKNCKTKKNPLSTSQKQNLSYNYEVQNHPLNYKTQSLNMSAHQMTNISMGKHNLSCSTYFNGTKSTKKTAKSKTSHSQKNLSTIVSSSNKENHAPKQSVKHQNKKMVKKGSVLGKDMEMFVNTRKYSEHLCQMKKKKK